VSRRICQKKLEGRGDPKEASGDCTEHKHSYEGGNGKISTALTLRKEVNLTPAGLITLGKDLERRSKREGPFDKT